MSAGRVIQLVFTAWYPNPQHCILGILRLLVCFSFPFLFRVQPESQQTSKNFRNSWKLKYFSCHSWHVSMLSITKQVWFRERGQSYSISTFFLSHTAPYPLLPSSSLPGNLSGHSSMIKMANTY